MFDWRRYLDFARTLVASPERSEASHRAAASRAYYAVFHKSREMLESEMQATFGRERIHAEVIRRLKEQERWQSAGQNLERLWKQRVHADYNAAKDFTARHAKMAVDLASDVLSQVESRAS